MSKTFKDLRLYQGLDKKKRDKRGSDGARRFKREKDRQDRRLFKRDVQFTTYIEKTAEKED